jgi:flagellar hook-length control protein FliK
MSNEMNTINPAGNNTAAKTTRVSCVNGKNSGQSEVKSLSGDFSRNSGLKEMENQQSDTGVSSFQKIYNEIAQSNKSARCKNEAASGTESDEAATAQDAGAIADQSSQSVLVTELIKEISVQTGADTNAVLEGLKSVLPGASEEASAIIQQAIGAISQVLKLKVHNGIEGITLSNPSQETIEQLAEMLSVLKSIAGVLDESVKLGQPMEYGNMTFDIPKQIEIQKTICEQMFKIEMALKMAGISGDVITRMAEKENGSVFNGITQATDPSTLSMPATHVKQVLGEIFVSKEEKVQALFNDLVKTLQKKDAPDSSVVLEKIVSIAKGEQSGAKLHDISPIDAQVLRKLLKIDSAAPTDVSVENTKASVIENKVAAKQNEKIDLPQTFKLLCGKTLQEAASQNKTDNNDKSLATDPNLKMVNGAPLFSNLKSAETFLSKRLEESVMTQVLDKINVAAKSGITEMRIMLRPESLGEMHLKIRLEGDVVTAKVYVENQQVKQIVEANLVALKDSLAQHNLQIGSFSVTINHNNDARDQMQMMAELSDQQGRGRDGEQGNGSGKSRKDDDNETQIDNGKETGKRYGSNTVEYFA